MTDKVIELEDAVVVRLRRVVELKKEIEDDAVMKNGLIQEFESRNEQLFNIMKDKRVELGEVEESLREDTLKLHQLTGEKKFVGGVGIRLAKVLEYDRREALKWATEHKLALALDVRAFEKIAKNTYIDLVMVTEVPKATIPQKIDLSSLEGE